GAVGVQEAWRELPAGSRTADPIVLFHHQHIQPGALQVAGVDQPVMAAAHDDHVPGLHAGPAISTALHLPDPHAGYGKLAMAVARLSSHIERLVHKQSCAAASSQSAWAANRG